MARSSVRADGQLTFGPAPSQKVGTTADGSKKVESAPLSSAFCDAGRLIDQARERAGLTRKEVCALMFIDDSRYSKWVSGSPADSPSLGRLLLLPPSFWFHLNQSLNERFGLRRMIAAQLLGAAADFVLAEGR